MWGPWLLLLLGLCGLLGCRASSALYQQGLSALAAGEYDRAVHALSWALVETPQHGGALTVLGIAYDRQDAFDAAVGALDRAHTLAPDDPRIHRYRGLSWLKQGQLDQARPELVAFLARTRGRASQEQRVRGLAVLDLAPLSDVVRESVADSLEAAFSHEQQLDALRMQISHLEGQRWMAHGHHVGRPSHRSRR
jgi:tetratricopeptide (TPR) repeat protein